jgi:hypothetical protein
VDTRTGGWAVDTQVLCVPRPEPYRTTGERARSGLQLVVIVEQHFAGRVTLQLVTDAARGGTGLEHRVRVGLAVARLGPGAAVHVAVDTDRLAEAARL